MEGVPSILEKLTFFQFDVIDDLMDDLASKNGLESDQAKYVMVLLLNFPLALMYSHLPTATMKHIFNVVVGICLAQLVFGPAWIHSLISSTIGYALMRSLPPGVAAQGVFLFTMAYLSGVHLYEMVMHYMNEGQNHRGPQMLLTLKMTSLAYNIYDGTVGKQYLKEGRTGDTQRRLALTEIPSALEYFGYIYCFPCFFAGPAFEYMEYISSVNGTSYTGNPSSSSSSSSSGVDRMPPNVLEGLKRLLVGLVCMGVYLIVGSRYPLEDLLSAERLAAPFLTRVLLCWVTLVCIRTRYYFAWKVAEGASIMAGYGLEGYNHAGEVKGWGGVSNVDILGFELAPNIRGASRAWNRATQGWLERYVYLRTGGSLVITYFVSAFWHGFYPGYYVFFLSLPLATELGRVVRSRVRPHFMPPLNEDGSERRSGLKLTYDWVGVCLTSLTFNYLAAPFLLEAWHNVGPLLGSFYYCGHVILLLLYLLVVGTLPDPKKKKAKQAKAV